MQAIKKDIYIYFNYNINYFYKYDSIGNEGITALIEALKMNESLTWLNLRYIYIYI